ncbi:SchA/CurD-like domain-containing protein [Yinghuangia seranimata]|uniref:SchA/CurD-like domain-containing protein n=1 Tax=Yinghuangia seranimata TaxID=408067 RepID=UPI00248B4E2F|nr:SchA/CurD-like domain-containing protein [Yinghuangia seranimata]MDI2128997.1 SchA/CurD-like domain-containing protein [Yinghuangia seranimata]
MDTTVRRPAAAVDTSDRLTDGAKLRVLLMLEIHDGSQERFLDAYESIRAQVAAVPGHLRDQLCQSIEDPTQWLITSEWEAADQYLAWVDSPEHQEMVRPLHGCVRGTRSLRFAVARETDIRGGHPAAEPGGAKAAGTRPAAAPKPPAPAADGVTRCALSFTVKPGSEAEVARILAEYESPDPHVNATTTLRRTSVFMHGNRVVRAIEIQGDMRAALQHVAKQPQVRAAEEALNPYLEEARDLDDAEAARQFFMSAGLAEAFQGTSPGPVSEFAATRVAYMYPVRHGRAEAAARLLARHDEAALADPRGPLAASSVYVRQDILVRVVDLRSPADADPATALGVDRRDPGALAELLDADGASDLADDAGLRRLMAACAMKPVTDRRATPGS